MNKIIIEKTKNIEKLEFKIPENRGVYLLVGPNGVGKTTLLICMDRICNSRGFANGFTNTGSWDQADQFTNAVITFQVENDVIKFRKKRARWVSSPKSGSKEFLERFNYSDTIFIRADSKRIDVKADDLRAGNLVSVERNVKDTMNTLFETNKYEKLMRLRNANGRGRQAIFFYVIKDGTMYYSEKRFSTGELALVRLVERIHTAPDNTLILLDEAELALHPRVQVKLLEYLKNKALEKNLTIFVSTHSPTMIKATSKENIFLLKNKRRNRIEVISPCYPATAIGNVDYEISTIFDYVFFVEDDMAKTVLRHMIKRYIKIEPTHATALCNIIPVGGFAQTAEMAVTTTRRVFAHSKVFAIVDQDAFENLEDKPVFNRLLHEHRECIKGFGFTPENWFIEQLTQASNELQEQIRTEFQIELAMIFADEKYTSCNSPKPRKLAKDRFNATISILSETSGNNEAVTMDLLIKYIVKNVSDGVIRSVLNPIFRMS